jgi:hydroxyacylglutathione hydrolase
MRLGRIGFNNVKGYLKDGMKSLKENFDLTLRIQQVSATTIDDLGGPITIPDIRSKNEWKSSYIEGSINITLNNLMDQISEVPELGHVIVHCQSGYRSMIALSLLEKGGRNNIFNLIVGYQAWKTTKKSTSTDKV